MVEGSREERLANRPNILFFHVDNLGFGELSCYSGGPFRGATTTRIDAFAQQGVRLTNYCPESQCTPTRSAPLTGRHAVRSGTHSVPLGASGGWGLVAWEKRSPSSCQLAATAYIYWMGREMYRVKWRNFKLVLVAQKYMSDTAAKLPTPRLINLTTDPQEREAVSLPICTRGRRRASIASSPSSNRVSIASR